MMIYTTILGSLLVYICSCVTFDTTAFIKTPNQIQAAADATAKNEYYIFATNDVTRRAFIQVQTQNYVASPFKLKMIIVDNVTLAAASGYTTPVLSFNYNLGGFAIVSNNRGEIIVALADFSGLKTQLYIYQFMWDSPSPALYAVTSFSNTTEYSIYTQWAKYYPWAYYIGFQMVQTVYPYISERYIAKINQTDKSTTYIAKVLTESLNSSAYTSISHWECAENVSNTSIFRCVYTHMSTGNIREFAVNMTDGTIISNSMSNIITLDGIYSYSFLSVTSLTNNSVALITKSQISPSKVLSVLGKFGKNTTTTTLYDITDGHTHQIQTAFDNQGKLMICEAVKTPDQSWSTAARLFSQSGDLLTTYSNLAIDAIPRYQNTFLDTTSETTLILASQDKGAYDETKANIYLARVNLSEIYQYLGSKKLVSLSLTLIIFAIWLVA